MPVRDRPDYLVRCMEDEPETGGQPSYEMVDIPPDQFALSSDTNIVLRRLSHWLTSIVTRMVEVKGLFSGPARLQCLGEKAGLQFATGTGSLVVAVDGALFHTEQHYITINDDVLARLAQTTHTCPANTTVFVYASGAPMDRVEQTGGQGTPFPGALPTSVDLYFDDVGLGNPATPPAGYGVVGGFTTDGIQVISNDAAPYMGQGLSFALDATWSPGTVISGDQLVLEHLVDSTAVLITSANNFAPAAFVIGAPGATGTLIQAQGTVTSTAPALVSDNPGPGGAASLSKFSGSGTVLDVQNFGTGRAVRVVHNAAGLPAIDVAALPADANGIEIDTLTGAALVLAPQNDPVTLDEGSVWVHSVSSRMSYRAPVTGNIKRVWASDHGLDFDRDYIAAGTASVAAIPVTIATVALYPFKQFARYTIHATFTIARAFGALSGTGQVTILVGGIGVPECNLRLFRMWAEVVPGIDDDLVSFSVQYQHVGPTASLNVELVLTAANKRYSQRGLYVLGHHQG